MQNEGGYRVCRLCLKSRECSFKDVEAITIQMLRMLGLEFYLDVSGTSVICKTCSETIQKCFGFKKICLCTEDCISSFRNDRNNVKRDLGEIYLRENGSRSIALSKCQTICRLCMEMVDLGRCIVLNGETKDISAKMILQRYFSELDLDITENPYICATCNESLHSYFNFVKNYLDVKDEIKKCDRSEGSDDTNQVESNNELQLVAKNVLNNQNGYLESDIDMYTNCDGNELYDQIELKLENIMQEESQEGRIKHETTECEEIEYVKVEELGDIVEKYYVHQQNGEIKLENENVEVENRGFNIKHEEIKIKTEEDNDRFQNNMPIPKNSSGITLHSCVMCKYHAKEKDALKQHMLIHKNASKVVMYSRELCTYKAEHKRSVKQHMLIHNSALKVTMYSCEICTYKTKFKDSLKTHMLVHKNASEVTMYSCELCTYKAKYKGRLKQHMLIHKNASEVRMYSCEICTYKAKHKCNLKQHMLIHKNASLEAMYSCELCTYKAKRKSSLINHMLIHKSTSEVTMYLCDICAYKAKRKGTLRQHMLIHKNTSEVKMYSCEICTYKTKQKGNLKLHMLIHKNSSEVMMYRCELCTYKAKHKGNLKQHMLTHKNASEVTT